MAKLRIGISGWRYPPWRGRFYPEALPQRLELHYASRQLDTIEINGSFYSLQHPASWRNWYRATPHGFVFAVKAPRFITHVRRLREVDKPLANFFASGVLELREKLGPLLWQFPPSLKYDHDLVDAFSLVLPRTVNPRCPWPGTLNNHLKPVGEAVGGIATIALVMAIKIPHQTLSGIRELFPLLPKHSRGRWGFPNPPTKMAQNL